MRKIQLSSNPQISEDEENDGKAENPPVETSESGCKPREPAYPPWKIASQDAVRHLLEMCKEKKIESVIAELLKHQQCLDISREHSFNILFLTETETTSYYTYNSQGHLFIINGSPKDKYGGDSAIISPSTRPFVKDVFQHSSRILHIVIASQSGDPHFIGVYAPFSQA